jgi:hypothetical protein
MSHREKCLSLLMIEMTSESPPKFFSKRETLINPLNDGNEWASQPYSGSGVGYSKKRY